MQWKCLSIIALTLPLAACQLGQYQRTQGYDEAQYAKYREQTDSASLEGRLHFGTNSGVDLVGRGLEVTLVPATDYGWETYRAFMRGQATLDDDPRAAAFRQTSITDTDGRYTFTNLAPGRYITMIDTSSSIYFNGLQDRFEFEEPRIAEIVEVGRDGTLRTFPIPSEKKP